MTGAERAREVAAVPRGSGASRASRRLPGRRSRVDLSSRRGPSTIMACQLCAGVAATEAALHRQMRASRHQTGSSRTVRCAAPGCGSARSRPHATSPARRGGAARRPATRATRPQPPPLPTALPTACRGVRAGDSAGDGCYVDARSPTRVDRPFWGSAACASRRAITPRGWMNLAPLSQLAVASLQIGLFCARKCLIRIAPARQNACSEDFGRCRCAGCFVQCCAYSCAANAARRTARPTSTGAWWRTAAWPMAAWRSAKCSISARSTPASASRGATLSKSATKASAAKWLCSPRAPCPATTSTRWGCA
jgi:hypothetical protein